MKLTNLAKNQDISIEEFYQIQKIKESLPIKYKNGDTINKNMISNKNIIKIDFSKTRKSEKFSNNKNEFLHEPNTFKNNSYEKCNNFYQGLETNISKLTNTEIKKIRKNKSNFNCELNCPNNQIIKNYEKLICELRDEIISLKKMNYCLVSAVERKDSIINNLMKNNSFPNNNNFNINFSNFNNDDFENLNIQENFNKIIKKTEKTKFINEKNFNNKSLFNTINHFPIKNNIKNKNHSITDSHSTENINNFLKERNFCQNSLYPNQANIISENNLNLSNNKIISKGIKHNYTNKNFITEIKPKNNPQEIKNNFYNTFSTVVKLSIKDKNDNNLIDNHLYNKNSNINDNFDDYKKNKIAKNEKIKNTFKKHSSMNNVSLPNKSKDVFGKSASELLPEDKKKSDKRLPFNKTSFIYNFVLQLLKNVNIKLEDDELEDSKETLRNGIKQITTDQISKDTVKNSPSRDTNNIQKSLNINDNNKNQNIKNSLNSDKININDLNDNKNLIHIEYFNQNKSRNINNILGSTKEPHSITNSENVNNISTISNLKSPKYLPNIKYSNKIITNSNFYSNSNKIPLQNLKNGCRLSPKIKTSNFGFIQNQKETLGANSNSKFLNDNNSHYNKIINLFKIIGKGSKEISNRTSFLNLTDTILKKMAKSDLISEISKLTQNDEEFIYCMRNFSEEQILLFNGLISQLIFDYKYAIELIRRVKSFLRISVQLVNSTSLDDAFGIIIKNCKEVVDCEKTVVYVYDKLSKMFNSYHENKFNNPRRKVSTEVGIAGWVFKNGQKLKIDDTYLDPRLKIDKNIEINENLNYEIKMKDEKNKTKTVLCVPSFDEDGDVCGAIECINKKNGYFLNDDEELTEIFAKQISSIFMNSIQFDEYTSHISRLKLLQEYSIKISRIKNKFDFTSASEAILMRLWSGTDAKIYFIENYMEINDIIENKKCIMKNYQAKVFDENCNNQKIKSLQNNENEGQEQIKYYELGNNVKNICRNIGLIGKCISKREIIPCESIYDNKDYNAIVDLECGSSILTVPIFDFDNEKKMASVAQFSYNFYQNKNSQIIGNHLDIINLFSQQASLWISNYKCEIENNKKEI